MKYHINMKEFNVTNIKSIYIHIPFCKRKCNYCAFISFANIDEFEEKYTNAIINEINNNKSKCKIETIYIGGGTPNLLSIKSLEKIFTALNKNFNISDNPEITMEFNPKISDVQYYKEVKNFGINRISLGAQSFNEEILKTLNRIHDTKDIFKAIENIRKVNINNYSLDLMYGIFGQTLNHIKKDLEIIKEINPPHVSTYGLKIEKGTPFEKYDIKNLPDEDTCADMYLLICKTLENTGYEHYEISNFAKKNYESKHNLTYWNCKEYFGFGVAAHGYYKNIRYKNSDNLIEYIKNPLDGEITANINNKELCEEKIMLGLRLKKGIDLDELKAKFNIDLLKNKKEKIENLISYNYIQIKNNQLSLTNKGFLISNYIISELM